MTVTLPTFLTVIGFLSLFVTNTWEQTLLSIVGIVLLSIRVVSLRPLLRAFVLVTMFCVPLFIIHGLFNQQFPLDGSVFGIDIRMNGFQFSHVISARIGIFVMIAVSWYQLAGDYTVDAFARLRLPVIATVIVAQSISIVRQIPRMSKAILLAQQSRGIKTGPGLLARIKALPTVILPLVSKLLIDAEPRAIALASRGFATEKMSTPSIRLLSRTDISFGVAATASLLVIKVISI